MNYSTLYLLQAGFLLMILLYCMVSFIVYQYKLHIYIMVHAINLLLTYYIIENQYLIEVFSFFFSVTYISSIIYYLINYTEYKINYRPAHLAQIIACFGALLYLVSYEFHFSIAYGIVLKILFIGALSIFWIKLSQIIKRVDSIWLGLLLCILSTGFYYFMSLYLPTTLLKNEWGDIVLKTVTIVQIILLMNAFIKTLYSLNTEKEILEKRFFQQMQENFLSHLRVKQINEDINSNLHDDVGSQLSIIVSLNQLALYWIDKDPNKAREIIRDMKETIETIPNKIENIIINNIADNYGKETIFFREMAAILFTPIQLKYTINIINESMWIKVNDTIQKHTFLIYKEILVNIIRHSKASAVIINVEVQKSSLVLSVNDNGIGFDTTKKREGYGLHSIRRRVEKLKGNLSIVSSKGSGCSINIVILF